MTSSFCARPASVNVRISSFCRCPTTAAAFTVSAFCGNSRNASPVPPPVRRGRPRPAGHGATRRRHGTCRTRVPTRPNMSGNGWVARWNSMTSRDGDHEIDADEQVQLPAPHPLDVIEVPRREQHHEQGRTVPLQLRAADAPQSRPAPAARATRTRWPPTGSPPRRAGTTRSRPARRGPAAPRRFPADRADRRCGALDVHGVVDQPHRSPPVPHLVNAERAEGRLRGSRRRSAAGPITP